MVPRKRVKLLMKTPNPLFTKWLSEWRDRAKLRKSKMEKCFNVALQSLRKYPLVLERGYDCKILVGFGEKMCRMLDQKLLNHRKQMTSNTQSLMKIKSIPVDSGSNSDSYAPSFMSIEYLVIIALCQHAQQLNFRGFSTMDEIINCIRVIYSNSGSKIDTETALDIWPAVNTLLLNQLVLISGSPPQFRLTPTGVTMADELLANYLVNGFIDTPLSACVADKHDMMNKNQMFEQVDKKVDVSFRSLYHKLDEILLVVDTHETNGQKIFGNHELLRHLNAMNAPYSVRNLQIGDFTWILKTSKEDQTEFILPFIVERKRMDDLAGSIKDGRFHEQKFRLKNCGIRNVIYLIEGLENNTYCSIPYSTLLQCSVNTCVQDGFTMKFTSSLSFTAQYLVKMTQILSMLFKIEQSKVSSEFNQMICKSVVDANQKLKTFQEFSLTSTKSKSLQVKDIFIKQLLHLKGMSVDKTIAITDLYPTPCLLNRGYENCGSEREKELLLSSIVWSERNKRIGPTLSSIIYKLFCTNS